MTAGRERGAAVTDIIDGKIYVAGGFRNLQASALVDVYDPGTNMWAPLADLPATHQKIYEDLYRQSGGKLAFDDFSKTFMNAPTHCSTCHQ